MTGATTEEKPKDDQVGSDAGLFVTIPITGEFADPKPLDPKEVVLRKAIYVEDWIERDQFTQVQEQAWTNALASKLSKGQLYDGVIMRMSIEDTERLNEAIYTLQSFSVPEFERRDGKIVVPISKPMREPKKGEDTKDPTELLWRKLFNRDLVMCEKDHGSVRQQVQLISNVCDIPLSTVKRLHLHDYCVIMEAAAKLRGKSLVTTE